jgi:hypothetical protein
MAAAKARHGSRTAGREVCNSRGGLSGGTLPFRVRKDLGDQFAPARSSIHSCLRFTVNGKRAKTMKYQQSQKATAPLRISLL